MAIDPNFDHQRQQVAHGVKVTVMMSDEEYRKGTQIIQNEIVKYFTDDTLFAFSTPTGPDAIFRVIAPRITREGKVTRGSISIEPTRDDIEWDSERSYRQWCYTSYDHLLDLLHGPQGNKPFALANSVIANVMNLKEPPKSNDNTTTPTPDDAAVVQLANGPSTVLGMRQLYPPRPGDSILSSLGKVVAQFAAFRVANPDATPDAIRQWMQENSPSTIHAFVPMEMPATTGVDQPPARTQSLPTFGELLPEYEGEPNSSPTDIIDGEWPMMFSVNEDFDVDEAKALSMPEGELLALLTMEISTLPLSGVDTELQWVTHRVPAPDYGSSGITAESDELVAITVPTENSKLQFYWSSFDNCFWARPVVQ